MDARTKSMDVIQGFWDWLLLDSHGNVVIWQKPNMPIYVTVGFYLLRWLHGGDLLVMSQWGVRLALMYWAYLEIITGVNGLRKLLGVSVILFLLPGIFVPYL